MLPSIEGYSGYTLRVCVAWYRGVKWVCTEELVVHYLRVRVS